MAVLRLTASIFGLACVGLSQPAHAQTAPDLGQVARSACMVAAEKYAPQTETFGDALKLVMHRTKDNPTEQAAQVQRVQSEHETFIPQAKAAEPAKAKPEPRQARPQPAAAGRWQPGPRGSLATLRAIAS